MGHLQRTLIKGRTPIENTWSRSGLRGLNLDQMGMCHWRLEFTTVVLSGKTQKGYPVLELPLRP